MCIRDSPNTISGLQAKRKELAKLIRHLDAEYKKVVCDIDHLDACIRLFDPDADIERVRLNRYATKHRAKKGEHQRFVLGCLRDASEPLTSKEISLMWIESRGLKPDESTRVILTKRTGATINALKHKGIVETKDYRDSYKTWQLVKTPLLTDSGRFPKLESTTAPEGVEASTL